MMAGCCRAAAVAIFRNPMISPFRSRNWSRNSAVSAPAGVAPQPVALHPDLDVLAREAARSSGICITSVDIGLPITFLMVHEKPKHFPRPIPPARRFIDETAISCSVRSGHVSERCPDGLVRDHRECEKHVRSNDIAAVQWHRLAARFSACIVSRIRSAFTGYHSIPDYHGPDVPRFRYEPTDSPIPFIPRNGLSQAAPQGLRDGLQPGPAPEEALQPVFRTKGGIGPILGGGKAERCDLVRFGHRENCLDVHPDLLPGREGDDRHISGS